MAFLIQPTYCFSKFEHDPQYGLFLMFKIYSGDVQMIEECISQKCPKEDIQRIMSYSREGIMNYPLKYSAVAFDAQFHTEDVIFPHVHFGPVIYELVDGKLGKCHHTKKKDNLPSTPLYCNEDEAEIIIRDVIERGDLKKQFWWRCEFSTPLPSPPITETEEKIEIHESRCCIV